MRERFRGEEHDTRAFSPRRGLPSRSPLDRARHPGEMPTPHARRGCVTTVLKPRRLTQPPLASTETRQALDRRPGDPRREARRRRRYVTATRRPTRRATRSTRPFRSKKKKTDDEKPTTTARVRCRASVFFSLPTRRRDAFRVCVVRELTNRSRTPSSPRVSEQMNPLIRTLWYAGLAALQLATCLASPALAGATFSRARSAFYSPAAERADATFSCARSTFYSPAAERAGATFSRARSTFSKLLFVESHI